MAKQGMKRPDNSGSSHKNDVAPVPELQGKAKHTKENANPIIPGTHSPSLKVYHSSVHNREKPISKIYPVIDNDLARDNVENDITSADLQDLQ